MKKFNLSKRASSGDYVISDKSIQKNREDMNLSNDQQSVIGKNINLSLPVKDKDNTIPFNKQLDAERKNVEAEPSIIESKMDDKEVTFGDKTEGIMPINIKTEEYNQKHLEDFKKAESSPKRDTAFWDKYVGVQLEGEGMPTKIDKNVPSSGSQLQNHPDRFKGGNIDKMVMASVKDADAMLFHIHATVSKQGRDINDIEKQQIIDINSGKTRLIAQFSAMPVQTLGTGDVIIRPNRYGKWLVYEAGGVSGGEPIDEFKSKEEALMNYPEGEIINA